MDRNETKKNPPTPSPAGVSIFDLIASPHLSTLFYFFTLFNKSKASTYKHCIYKTSYLYCKIWTFTPQMKVSLGGKWDQFSSRHFKFGARQSINELSLASTFQRSEARPSRLSLKDCSKGNADSFKSNKMHVKSDNQSHYTWDQFHHFHHNHFSEDGPAVISLGM